MSHPVYPLPEADLDVLSIPNIASKNPGTVFPPHLIAGTVRGSYPGGYGRGAPRVALACFARLASG